MALIRRPGRFDEGVGEIQRARELDPVSLEVNGAVGLALYFARRYDEAIAAARQTLEMDPQYPLALRVIGMASMEKGLNDQAIAAFQRHIASVGSQNRIWLGYAYGVTGQRAEALKILNELKDLSKRKYVASFDIATVYVGLGERDQALEWLEKSYAERERWLVTLQSPVFDPLRSDPRFANLVRRVGLWQ